MAKIFRLTKRIGLVVLLPACLLAAEASSANSVIVADSRRLTGIREWWANLYNESHLQFALLTVLLIPLAGAVLGSAADFLISRLGIDLKSRALREG
jgi:hypothetical protein